MKKVIKNTLKSSLCFLLIFTMLSSMLVFAANDEPWDANYNPENNPVMPFTPEDKYVSVQNPPDFRWGHVKGAVYEVVVATDPELKDIKYQKDGIKNNYYNFNYTFETGILYYWAVRYKVGSKTSSWSKVRRFRIDPDAHEFTVMTSEEMLEQIPKTHPRTLILPGTLEEVRSYKDQYAKSKEAYDALVRKCDQYIADGVDDEPTMEAAKALDTKQMDSQKLRTLAARNYTEGMEAAFLYTISGEEKYASFARDCFMEVASWDINGVTSYASQDQVHREIAYMSAVAYDLLYDYLSESERQTILKCVKERTKVMEYLLDKLDESPYDSHGKTAYGFILIIAFATYGDLPESAAWLEKTLTGYTSIQPTWGNEDGGWSQGTSYWQWVNPIYGSTGMPGLANVLKIGNKAYSKNRYLYYLYAYNPGSYGGFGDQSGRKLAENSEVPGIASSDAYSKKNPVIKWLAEQLGSKYQDEISQYLYASAESIESTPPYTYQLAHEFPDIGWAIMTDSLINKDRIKLMFKSSQFGSYNHSESDQNAFLIEAFGEPLAVNSGYYDSYHSTHNSGFTRKTHAHNSVTIDNSKGQTDDSFAAKGYLTAFLTQEDFDLAQGDATQAYNGGVSKFVRNVIYIRPDMFVIVDDLKAKAGRESEFEWWLNAREAIKLYNEGNGARLQKGEAVLDATVQYPKKVKSFYNNIFAGADMREYAPTGTQYASDPVDTRVWFETEKTAQTKMIVTLDVHRDNVEARSVNTEYFDKYVKMVFEDGTVMLVNLGENTEEIETADGFKFTGQVVVYNDDSIMLVGGTSLKEGDKELITLEKEGSVVMGRNELSISAYYDDNKITVNTNNDYISEFKGATDYNGRELTKAIGITYEVKDDYVTFDVEKDNYQLMLNGKMITDDIYTTTVKLIIDGKEQNVELTGTIGRNGEAEYTGMINLGGNKYRCISKNDELFAGSFYPGVVSAVSELNLKTTAEDNVLELEMLPVFNLNTVEDANYDAIKDRFAVFVEGENADGGAPDGFPKGAAPYTTRSFLSGGKGVSGFNTLGTNISYTFEIKEEGNYDFVVKYVAWNEGGAKRSFSINGVEYVYNLPKTPDYGTVPESWRAAVTDSNIHLTPGTYTLVMSPMEGSWNYDWFGFLKR